MCLGFLQSRLIAPVKPLGADLLIPDFHPLFVLVRSLGAGPSNELGKPVKMIRDELADGIATCPESQRPSWSIFCSAKVRG